jgi:hypothetical protein
MQYDERSDVHVMMVPFSTFEGNVVIAKVMGPDASIYALVTFYRTASGHWTMAPMWVAYRVNTNKLCSIGEFCTASCRKKIKYYIQSDSGEGVGYTIHGYVIYWSDELIDIEVYNQGVELESLKETRKTSEYVCRNTSRMDECKNGQMDGLTALLNGLRM